MKEDFTPFFGPGRHILSIGEVREKLAPQGSREIRTTLYLNLYALHRKLLDLRIQCELWIDGSYVTEKPEPTDIDLSIMVYEDIYQAASEEAKSFLDEISFSNDRYLGVLDAFVCIYGEKGSEDYELDDPLDWAKLWGKDHSDRYLKGFVVVEVFP